MVSAASLNESTLSSGFFESTGACNNVVGEWFTRVDKSPCKSERIPMRMLLWLLWYVMVLLLKRSSCFRKCCVFFFQRVVVVRVAHL